MFRPKYCYVDDSIHDNFDFIALAFVFSDIDLDDYVQSALKAANLDPASAEYKSGVRMDRNPAMQIARDGLIRVVRNHVKVGLVIAQRHHDASLGRQCMQALQSILIRNGISPKDLRVHVDEGIFTSRAQAAQIAQKFIFLSEISLFPCEKSHVCRGIQVADLVAHTLSQVVRDGVSESPRLIDAGGAANGYEEGEMLLLSDLLIAGFGYSMLRRSMVLEGQEFDPATDPIILALDEDATSYGLYPEALGWGVQVSQQVPDVVRNAVFKMLGRIWLGCMH